MIFNSFQFLIFFPIIFVIYFSIPYKYRWILLLLSSYYFYMVWKREYIILILITTFISYSTALLMSKKEDKKSRKPYLIICLVLNFGILFVFKYFNLFNSSMQTLFQSIGIGYDVSNFNLLLPMGISFYTFQTVSYTIDVYRGTTQAEKHFGIYSLYVTFFPQLVAGPIERSERLLPQFYEKHDFDYNRVTNGLKIMAWGFFKKLVIADRLAVSVNTIYNNPTEYQGLALLLATVFFAFQIFCDFSGYSDIAIGAAKVMGFELMKNFERPYFSKSIAEFWRRWHISLSSWFKDYVYIPLGGNRCSKAKNYFNIFITFMLSGLWHGANWTFVIWGTLHGLYQIIGKILNPINQKLVQTMRLDKHPYLHKCIQLIITFSLVCFAWIFFRANTISDALYIITHLFTGIESWLSPKYIIDILTQLFPSSKFDFVIIFFSIGLMEFIHLIQRKHSILHIISKYNGLIRFAIYYISLLYLLLFLYVGNSQFIYFQF